MSARHRVLLFWGYFPLSESADVDSKNISQRRKDVPVCSSLPVYFNEYQHDPTTVEGPERLFECAFGAYLHAGDMKSRVDQTRIDILPRGLWAMHVLSGMGVIKFAGRDVVRVGAGDTVVMTVHDSAEFVNHLEKNKGFRSVTVIADADSVKDDQIAQTIDNQTTSTSLSVISRNGIVDVLTREFGASFSTSALAGLAAESCAASMLRHCLLSKTGVNGSTKRAGDRASLRQRLELVRNQLISEPDKDYNLAMLAQGAGLGISTLKQRFSETYNQSVFAFLQEIRLSRAYEQLHTSDLSIAQIAYAAGFNHPGNFSTAFRRKFGLSPGMVRDRS